MITNPITSGIFETDFKKIADAVHQAGGLVYMDEYECHCRDCKPQRTGVDAVHNNLHKTWTIPHGGGGPGMQLLRSQKLVDFCPASR